MLSSAPLSFLRHKVPLAAVALLPSLCHAEFRIGKTPVLSANLPAGSTWQVEARENDGSWQATGVLFAGAAGPVTARLDGLPAASGYRLARVGQTEPHLFPAVTWGLHLAGQAAGSTEIALETSADLAGWSPAAVVHPDAEGRYLRAIRPPLAGQAFFRAYEPALPTDLASVTSYSSNPAQTFGGFGSVADEMPELYRNGYTTAVEPSLFHRDGMNAAGAGECYELAGPNGTVTVMVDEIASDSPPPIAASGRTYFDMNDTAFTAFTGRNDGFEPATYRLVPAPVTGNVKVLAVSNSLGFYLELRPYNHRAGVSRLEVRSNGSATWLELPRTSHNSFVFNSGTGGITQLQFPLRVRIRSRFDETVESPPILSMTAAQRIDTGAQFEVFPDLGPQPAWTAGPVYTDGMNTTPGDAWAFSPYSGATVDSGHTAAAHQGTASLRIENLGFYNGVTFSRSYLFPKPEYGSLTFAIRAAASGPVNGLAVTIQGKVESGTSSPSATVALPPANGDWQVIRIPLDAVGAPPFISGFLLSSTTTNLQPALLLDSISFIQP